MRAVKAKQLRKQVYGAGSHRVRTYAVGHEPRPWTDMQRSINGGWTGRPNPTCICTGGRRTYQDAKTVPLPF